MGNIASDIDIQEKIRGMVQRIVDGFDPEKIILFGSHARGEANADSDVDLLVIKQVVGSKRKERVKIGVAVHGIGVAKDIVVATPEEVTRLGNLVGTVLYPALREGKVLYERSLS